MMKKLAGMALGVSLLAVQPALAGDGDTGFYVELGGGWSASSDYDLEMDTNAAPVSWETDSGWGYKVQIGWDFGQVRSDLKVNYWDTGLESVGGLGLNKSDYRYGTGTVNVYWDIQRFELGAKDGDFEPAFTPFIGAGLGWGAGYLMAKDTRNHYNDHGDHGFAWRVSVGGLFNITESIGLTLNYDYLGIATEETGHIHGLEMGLRYTF